MPGRAVVASASFAGRGQLLDRAIRFAGAGVDPPHAVHGPGLRGQLRLVALDRRGIPGRRRYLDQGCVPVERPAWVHRQAGLRPHYQLKPPAMPCFALIGLV